MAARLNSLGVELEDGEAELMVQPDFLEDASNAGIELFHLG